MSANVIGGIRRSRRGCRSIRVRLRKRAARAIRSGEVKRVLHTSHRRVIKARRLMLDQSINIDLRHKRKLAKINMRDFVMRLNFECKTMIAEINRAKQLKRKEAKIARREQEIAHG